MTPHLINNDIYYKDAIIATIEESEDSVEITPTPCCSIGQFLAALTLLRDLGYKKIIERAK